MKQGGGELEISQPGWEMSAGAVCEGNRDRRTYVNPQVYSKWREESNTDTGEDPESNLPNSREWREFDEGARPITSGWQRKLRSRTKTGTKTGKGAQAIQVSYEEGSVLGGERFQAPLGQTTDGPKRQ